MEFIIDRSKWRCGGNKENKIGRGKTSLLNTSGFMCCLGQTCNQLGIKKKDLLKLGEPSEIIYYETIPEIFTYMKQEYYDESSLYNTPLSSDAMTINDDEEIGQKERERQLRELFKKHGHKIKFTGKIG